MTAIGTIGPQHTAPELVPPARQELERLAALRAPGKVFVTCYVRLGVEERIRHRYRIAVRDRARELILAFNQVGVPHEGREQIRRDLERIDAWLSNAGLLPHARGVAIFACEALDVFQAFPVPRVLQTRVLLDEGPRIAELYGAAELLGRTLVALVDRGHVRLFEVKDSEVEELPCPILPTTRGGKFHGDRGGAPGWGEHDFDDRIREERHRQAAAVARTLTELAARGPCQGLVIAGPAKATAEQLRFLPEALRAKVMGTPRLNPTMATLAEVRAAALDALEEAERTKEHRLLADLGNAIGGGWAVTGARATLRALGKGQVRVLLVPAGQIGGGFRCADTGRLVLAKGDCRGEGTPVPVADLVNQAIEEALGQRVEVVVVHDPEVAELLEGLAALLRFR